MFQDKQLPSLIILIGPMGAGKSTVGHRVAEILGYQFYDVDSELEQSTGVSVNLIFEIEKEAGFRLRETRMLKSLLNQKKAIIATGGGIVVEEENRLLLRNSGAMVVYLKTEVKEQLRRLKRDKKRPLLRGLGKKQRLKNLARIRNPLYAEAADLTILSGPTPSHHMAQEVVTSIQDFINYAAHQSPAIHQL